MKIFCGIDWASDHHDIALIDTEGTLVARARISDDATGLQQLLDLLAEHGDTPETRIPAAIETTRGLLVACLRATGRRVYAITPMAASRYRERHTIARKKSDHLDAMVLANILRTDAAVHRTMPADTELAQAIAVLARAQQDAVWDRTQAANKLRSHLREYFPGYLAAVQPILGGLCSPVARALLAAAPTPARAARLTRTQLQAVLKKAGRQRGIEAEVTRLHAALRAPQMRQLPLVEDAMGRQTLTLMRKLDTACTSADELAEASVKAFEAHPDAGEVGRRRGTRGLGPFPTAPSRTVRTSFPVHGSPVIDSEWRLWPVPRGCAGGIFGKPRGFCACVLPSGESTDPGPVGLVA
ncbi:IS110 family transposase [Streptomyces sp. NPDC058086]|uniref:IS110 family transposase n=1 Tax=Streptomyces sp. NPDC058086 TaxID=3346334 RepID=UPI0036E95A24